MSRRRVEPSLNLSFAIKSAMHSSLPPTHCVQLNVGLSGNTITILR